MIRPGPSAHAASIVREELAGTAYLAVGEEGVPLFAKVLAVNEVRLAVHDLAIAALRFLAPNGSRHNCLMGYSEIVSTAAFLLALFVAWRTWRWDRPVIKVHGKQWLGGLGTTQPDKTSFSVKVANRGNHATQILSAFWQVERRNARVQTIPASHGGGGIESLFQAPSSSKEPVFPFNLDRHQQQAWDFEMSLDGLRDRETITRMRPGVEFMSRKDHHAVYGTWQQPKLP